MKLCLLWLLLLLGSGMIWAQNKIKGYEYWFDQDFDNRVVASVAPVQSFRLAEMINAEHLRNGLHAFHIRFVDEQDGYSGISSQFFYKMPMETTPTRKIDRCEYWFDNAYGDRLVIQPFNGEAGNLKVGINTESLSEGLHVFNICFVDDHGLGSSVLSQFFYKFKAADISEENMIEGYRYWFDDDFDHAVYTPLGTSKTDFVLLGDLDVSQIPVGLHTIHFQFKDGQGQWSSVSTDEFDRTIASAVIENGIDPRLVVYPNPTAGKVSVDLGEMHQEVEISVSNLNGTPLSSLVFSNVKSVAFELNQPAGIYILTISSGGRKSFLRLVKYK